MAPRTCIPATKRGKKQQVRRQKSAQAPAQGGPAYQASHGQGLATVIKQDPPKIGFSDFPGELRNAIYEHALILTEDEAIPIANFPGISNLRDLGYNLVNTCKVIQEEARPFFYSNNIFRIDVLKINSPELPYETLQRIEEEVNTMGRADRAGNGEVRLREQRRQEYALRHVHAGLAAMSDTDVALVKTLVFALHAPNRSRGENAANVDITRGTGVLQLELIGEEHYSVIDTRLDGKGYKVLNWEHSEFGKVLKNMIEVRDLTVFTKKDVLELATAMLERWP